MQRQVDDLLRVHWRRLVAVIEMVKVLGSVVEVAPRVAEAQLGIGD